MGVDVVDPWSERSAVPCDKDGSEFSTVSTYAGFSAIMESCGENITTPKCYEEADSGKGYIVYSEYEECQESWLLLPGFNLLPDALLIVVYFLFLIWLFLGIAIISDKFMSAIEVITAKKKVIKRANEKTGEMETIEVQFWNPTVANLTLLALGSSAPEIILAVYETCKNLVPKGEVQKPGELGAATIVGSASFNLLAISAVCMLSVPKGEVRKISQLKVFLMTAFFSVVAYIWVLIVYTEWTPNIISLPEAIITALLFPLFVWLSYAADQNFWRPRVEQEEEGMHGLPPKLQGMTITTEDGKTAVDRKQIAALMKQKDGNEEDPNSLLKKVMDLFPKDPWNALRFRINAARRLGGKAHKVTVEKEHSEGSTGAGSRVHPVDNGEQGDSLIPRSMHSRKFAAAVETVFMFKASSYSVMENGGVAKIGIKRGGPLNSTVSVDFHTEDGTATVVEDYKETTGTLVFNPGEEVKFVEVPIVDDDQYEPDENFYVKLTNPSEGEILNESTEVTIIDDDEPGYAYINPLVEVSETATLAEIEVERRRGADGKVSVEYATEDNSAIAGADYVPTKGVLQFEHGETSKIITVPLTNSVPDIGANFRLKLSNGQGGLTLSKKSQCTIQFVDDTEVSKIADEVLARINRKEAATDVEGGGESFLQQFLDAMAPEASVDDEGNEVSPGVSDMLLHYLTITWKVVFCLVPPPSYGGGWYAFGVSLGFIGGVTAIVEQVATMFGCVLGLSPTVTAITFVALGTSLPDTFASMQATVEADDADAAIGNITGSNSVNVFLGLGLPWVIATCYYEAQGECFRVKSGALGFSVMIFCILAACCLSILLLRRMPAFGGGELGGGEFGKYLTAGIFFTMWIVYIVASAMQNYGHIDWDTNDDMSAACP